MPIKKTTKKNPTKKAKATEEDSTPAENSKTSLEKDTQPNDVVPEEVADVKVVAEEKKASSDGQLFFSTDGNEPEKPDVNPFDKDSESKVSSNSQEKNDKPKSGEGNVENKTNEQEQLARQSNQPKHNHPHQHGQNKKFKKQNWQDKKRQNNKPRPKFKKSRKLPYEDTESKPLDLGSLLEFENLKTEVGVSAFAELFAASEEESIQFNELYELALTELKEKVLGLSLEIELPPAPTRDEIFDLLLDACLKMVRPVEISAVIEVTEDGHGFLLHQKDNYRLKAQSPFVPSPLIKRFGLKTGHLVRGYIHPKIEGATCPILVQVDKIMDADPEDASRIMPFTELVPYYPLERIFLETNADVEWDNVSMRVVDLVSPIGFGQRGLIVAPPRTGKTVLQQAIARALRVNNPKAHLIVLLVDERPEEVTDFRRAGPRF